MKTGKFRFLFFICGLIIFMIAFTGCTSSGQQASYSPQVLPHADLHVNMGQTEEKWSLGLGCYWLASGTAYNAGNAQSNNAVATLNLIDSSGAIRDSKSISLGSLMPGASQSFQETLDGECGHSYSLRYSIS
jgi:hypothetical protein